MKKIFPILLTVLVSLQIKAQIVNNALITVSEGAIVTFNDDLQNGSQGKIINKGDIQLNKNFSNNGQFSSEGNLDFSGNTLQVVSGSEALDINSLELNNDIELQNSLFINSNVEFNRGVLNSSSDYPVVFTSLANHTGASDFSHIKGKVVKQAATNFEFPIGNGNTYRGYKVSSKAGQVLSTDYFESNPLLVSNELSNGVERINETEYWVLKSEGNSSNTQIKLDAGYGDNQVTYLKNGSWKVAGESTLTEKSGLKDGVIFTSGRGKIVRTDLGIWPNPTQGEFNLKLTGLNSNMPATVDVINQDGRVVLHTTGTIQELRKVYSIPAGFSASELTVRVTAENEDPMVDKLILIK